MNRVTGLRSMRVRVAALLTALAAVAAMVVQPAFVGSVPGSLDPTYGNGGIVDMPPLGPDAPPGLTAFPATAALTPSGALWANEWGSKYDQETGQSAYYHRLTRVSSAGAAVGSVPIPSTWQFPVTVVADGESAIVVDTLALGGTIRRYLPDLTQDSSFGGDGVVSLDPDELGVLPPECAVGGCPAYFTSATSDDAGGALVTVMTGFGTRLVRLTSAGVLDPSFNAGAPAVVPDPSTSIGGTMTVDMSGRILVSRPTSVSRFLSDGTLDPNFGDGGLVSLSAYEGLWGCSATFIIGGCAMAPLPDGSLLVAGNLRATTDDPNGAPGFLQVSADGTSVEFREFCTPPTGGGPGEPGCGPIGSPFVTTSGGTSELHFITSNILRTLPLPLPAGQLLSSAVSSPLNSPLVLVSAGPGTSPNVAFGTGARLTSNGYTPAVARIRLDVEPPPPAEPTGTITPPSGNFDVGATVPVTFSCENTMFCSALVVDEEVPDPIPPGWFPQGASAPLNSGDLLDTSAPGVKTVVLGAAAPGGGMTFVARARFVIGSQPEPPSATLSPPSGTFSIGTQVPVDFSCSNATTCVGAVIDGEVPDPIPQGWVPPSPVPITSGDLLDTSTAGVRSVVIGTVSGTSPVYLATARYEIFDPLSGYFGTTTNGGSFSTGSTATAEDPLVTSVTTPIGGSVRLLELPNQPWMFLQGYEWSTHGVEIEAPDQTVAAPRISTFQLHTSLTGGASASSIVVGSDGVVVGNCVGGSNATSANPSPCVKSRRTLPNGNVEIVALSTSGFTSGWGFGRMTAVPPEAPTGVVATPGIGSAYVTWDPLLGSAKGGALISEYVVTATPVPGTVPPGVSAPVRSVVVRGSEFSDPTIEATVSSLAKGVSYTFTVKAKNRVHPSYGPSSAPSPAVQISALPDAPVITDVVGGIRSATVSWQAPDSDEPLTRYTVVATATRPDSSVHKVTAAVLGSPPATSTTVTKLLPGLSYSFTVSATSAAGTGAMSTTFGPVALSALPEAPVVTAVAGGVKSATVSWEEPDSDEPLTKYTVVATATRPDSSVHKVTKSVLGTPPATSTTVTGLLPGLGYSFTVSATSAVGTGATSASFGPVELSGVPGTPLMTDATAGARSATVTWDEPVSDEPVTKYTIVAIATRPDSSIHRVTKTVTAPATSTTVTGLTFGLQYSFTISATSAVGASPVSTPFGPVTPTFGVSISNRSLTEGNSGQKSFTFTITLTDAQTVPVTVDVATEDGSAEGTSDFAVLSTIVTLDPGQKSKTVTVRVSGDTIIEPDEVFFVNLSNASGGVITNARGTGTIRNDDIG